jgi:peptide/nickel transport system permease protein
MSALEPLQAPAQVPIESSRRAFARIRSTFAHNRAAAFGAIVLLLFVVVAVIGPLIAPYGVHEKVGPLYGKPSWAHPLGLDDGGEDMLSLMLIGTRSSLVVGFAAAVVAGLVGGAVGLISGYAGGLVDGALMRLTDYVLVIPALPLMIVVAALWGPSLFHIVLVIGLTVWAATARTIRAQALTVRERGFVRRSQSQGAGHLRVLWRHMLPQLTPLLVATTVLTISTAIFYEAALAFLGLADPNIMSWGRLIANAFDRSATSAGAWWAIVPPGVCIAVVVLGASLVGNALEDAFNPRLKTPHVSPRTFRIRRLPVAGAADDDNKE